ncbi:hypothetical protein AB6A40_009946 [Gnathostoma spinigerum]|uniref:CUB domain-containing protein n=1 Tax=Gnathostoma spinigerum TaxID=75299 RepID=A0ABD6F1J6_9BILA
MSVGDGKIHISLIITLVFCLQSIPIFAQQQEQQQSGCHCPQSTFGVTVFRGEIKSPGYPNLYCASLQCVYEILPANERSIVLLIESFETEATYDFLDIFETFRISDVTHEVKLKRLSGNDVGTPSFVSPISGGFRLKFSSDATEHFRGFLARFNRVRSPDGGQKCPTVFYEATMQPQELPSPLKNFHFETGCVFMINSTERYAISFRVDKIDSAAELTLYEAEEYANDKALKRIVNPGGPSTSVPFIPQQISSRTNSLVVVFRLIASHYQRIHTTPRSTTSQNEDYFKASFSRIDSREHL